MTDSSWRRQVAGLRGAGPVTHRAFAASPLLVTDLLSLESQTISFRGNADTFLVFTVISCLSPGSWSLLSWRRGPWGCVQVRKLKGQSWLLSLCLPCCQSDDRRDQLKATELRLEFKEPHSCCHGHWLHLRDWQTPTNLCVLGGRWSFGNICICYGDTSHHERRASWKKLTKM